MRQMRTDEDEDTTERGEKKKNTKKETLSFINLRNIGPPELKQLPDLTFHIYWEVTVDSNDLLP